MPALTGILKQEYRKLYDSLQYRVDRIHQIEDAVDLCMKNKERYEKVVEGTKIPWFFVAIIHHMESGCNFNTHLHNGDPLTHRTVQVPAGRPKNPPANGSVYTWEESAKDALEMKGYHQFVDWTVEWLLYRFEGYNGFGYRKFKNNTPYLWSFSNHYLKGRYVRDGKYDPESVSQQVGAACILKLLEQKGFIKL